MADTTFELPQIQVAGTPREMGQSYGEQLREQIKAFVAHRLSITGAYLAERGFEGEADLLRVGASGLAALERAHPEGFEELAATAEAAGVDAAALFAAGNYSDIRDVVLLGGSAPPDPSADGCTAFVLPHDLSREHAVLAGQTWDLHPADVEFVVAVKRKPDDGPRTWSITTVGCPTLIGLNEHGVYVGTTNIKVSSVRDDAPGYLNILHLALTTTSDAPQAAKVFEQTPRLAAHTYWAADLAGGVEVEASAGHAVTRQLGGGVNGMLLQTNHCLEPQHIETEAEPPSDSSVARFARAKEILAAGGHDVESLKAMMGDREGAPNCISRHHEDEQYAATNACAIADLTNTTLHACRGPADRGAWVELRP